MQIGARNPESEVSLDSVMRQNFRERRGERMEEGRERRREKGGREMGESEPERWS